MIGSTVIFLLVSAVAVPKGQVTATSGAVKVERGGRSLTANLRSGFEPGDRITTGPSAGVGLYLYAGESVYLGPDGALAVPASGEPEVRLEKGELRATVASPLGLTVVAGGASARVDRGTVWAESGHGGARFRAEHGSVVVTAAGGPPVTLAAGQEAVLTPGGGLIGPNPADPAKWALRVGALQLAGAADESRRAKQGQIDRINDESASQFASGQLPPGEAGPEPTGAAAQPDTTTPPSTNPTAADQPADEAYQPLAVSQTNSSFSGIAGSLALGGAAGAFSSAGSGGLGNDAQQDSRNPAFPGNIFLVTAQSRYSLDQVRLTAKDTFFPTDRQYYSIGLGAPPTSRVVTNFQTGTGDVPQSIRIPHFNAYVLNLSQYNIPDPATNPGNSALTGISGLLGPNPVSPQIRGANPLPDPRAAFNNRATFALGEFALQRDPSRPTVPQIEVRRSDQDRLIVPGTGPADPVTPNPQIFPRYSNVKDTKFFPEFPQGVKVPNQNGLQPQPTLARLDILRKAAVTTLLADKLLDYSHRTGQTQFVVDGLIINTAGYRRNLESPRPVPPRPALAATAVRPAVGPNLRSFGPRPEVGGTGPAARVASVQQAGRHR